MKKTVLAFGLTILTVFTLFGFERGNTSVQWFPPMTPLISFPWENYATSSRLEFQNSNLPPTGYPWSDGYEDRVTVGIRLGVEAPFLEIRNDEWRIYAGSPFSLEVINDFFQTDTAPIVNTDFWFGMRLEGIYFLNTGWPGNIAFSSLPVYHESTHLGDEVALAMAENDPDFYRINVSYEAWKFTLSLDEWERDDSPAYNLRFGIGGNWNSDGYYNLPGPSERGSTWPEGAFYPSRRGMEYSGQFNLVFPRGFPAIGKWIFQGGVEVRNRILFDYLSASDEKRIWTVVASAGWYRYPEGFLGRKIGFYTRVQYGQNPMGQFREQSGYFVFATGISFGL
jgi:hypothetical protein